MSILLLLNLCCSYEIYDNSDWPKEKFIPLEVAAEITAQLRIPTIGIGAGMHCDGQVLVCYDMLGMTGDFHDGFGWIGLVVFEMTRVRHRWLPVLPGMHAYPEINVRTYCKKREKHGIYF